MRGSHIFIQTFPFVTGTLVQVTSPAAVIMVTDVILTMAVPPCVKDTKRQPSLPVTDINLEEILCCVALPDAPTKGLVRGVNALQIEGLLGVQVVCAFRGIELNAHRIATKI